MISRPDLREELLRRAQLDQTARRAAASGEQALETAMAVDDDNTRWLEQVVRRTGWPVRSMVGEDGAHAAWLLAQHTDRCPQLQRRCLTLLQQAAAVGEADAADLAHLTDRVCLASGKPQVYGTQLVACDGRFVPRPLRDPETVDQRRAAVGLEALQTSLETALERFGQPQPLPVTCRNCGAAIHLWPPEPRSRIRVRCSACGWTATLRLLTGTP
jgi:hypothetical protein